MARKTIEQRLAEIENQRKTLKARLGKMERTQDTRRKVLLGAPLLHKLDKGGDEMSTRLRTWLRAELPGFLARDVDKVLFADLLEDQPAKGEKSQGPKDAEST